MPSLLTSLVLNLLVAWPDKDLVNVIVLCAWCIWMCVCVCVCACVRACVCMRARGYRNQPQVSTKGGSLVFTSGDNGDISFFPGTGRSLFLNGAEIKSAADLKGEKVAFTECVRACVRVFVPAYQ